MEAPSQALAGSSVAHELSSAAQLRTRMLVIHQRLACWPCEEFPETNRSFAPRVVCTDSELKNKPVVLVGVYLQIRAQASAVCRFDSTIRQTGFASKESFGFPAMPGPESRTEGKLSLTSAPSAKRNPREVLAPSLRPRTQWPIQMSHSMRRHPAASCQNQQPTF